MFSSTLPRITIIIGVLNMREGLRCALNSLFSQNYENIELMIFDGASTDGTLDVIKEYETHINFWKSEKDRGHTEACNRGIDIATGDFIHFLNADDLLEPGLLHKVAQVYQAHPNAQIISCGATITHQGNAIKVITSPDDLQINLSNMLFGLPLTNTRFFHKSIFEKFGKFPAISADGKYNIANDREFFITLALNNIRTEIIPEPLYHYFSHAQSLTFSNRNAIKIHQEHIKIAEKQLKNIKLNKLQKKQITLWQTQEWLRLAWVNLKHKQFLSSIEAILLGLIKHPLIWTGQAIKLGVSYCQSRV